MSVSDSDNQGKPQVAQPAAAQQAYQAQQPYLQPQTNQAATEQAGLSSMNTMFKRGGSFDKTEVRLSSALKALTAVKKEAVETQQLADDFDVFSFDRESNQVGVSSVLVVKTVKVDGNTYALVRTLMLESESQKLRPRVFNNGMQRLEMPTLAPELFDDRYWAAISAFLAEKRGIELVTVDSGLYLIEQEFDFADVDSVNRILFDSVNRIGDVAARLRNEQPFDIVKFKRPDEKLTASFDFTGNQRFTMTGMPIRADVRITQFKSLNTNQNSQEHNQYYDDKELSSVSGYVNLEWTPPQQGQQVWGQAPKTQIFTPTFVVTEVAQGDWIEANTMELYLGALNNAYSITAGNAWMSVFDPAIGVDGPDMRDIGAIGFMVNGQKIDTRSGDFKVETLAEILGTLVEPQPVFLLDIDNAGANSRLEAYFAEAAVPGPNQERARQVILNAANNYTGGHFAPLFDPRAPIVLPYNQQLSRGYYPGNDGERRDPRDLDVLAMLNLTNGNMADFHEWYRTLADQTMPEPLRLQKREAIERRYLGKNLRVFNRVTRYVLDGGFIVALATAVRNAGINVQVENTTTIMGGTRFAGNTMLTGHAVQQSAPMGYSAVGGNNNGYTVAPQGPGRLY